MILIAGVVVCATLVCASIFESFPMGMIWGISFGMMAFFLGEIPPKDDADG